MVPMALVGGQAVECGYDDVLCLSFHDDVLLCAEVLKKTGRRVESDTAVGGAGPLISSDVVMVMFREGWAQCEGFHHV